MWEGEDGQSGSGRDAWRDEWRWMCGVREWVDGVREWVGGAVNGGGMGGGREWLGG